MAHAGVPPPSSTSSMVQSGPSRSTSTMRVNAPYSSVSCAQPMWSLRQADHALEQLGISAADMLTTGRPRLWISITAYGRSGPSGTHVGFGDDAAVAGGLVAWSGNNPVFCGDAIADPLTGLIAASQGIETLRAGGRCVLDIAMARRGGLVRWADHPRSRGRGAFLTIGAPAGTRRTCDGHRHGRRAGRTRSRRLIPSTVTQQRYESPESEPPLSPVDPESPVSPVSPLSPKTPGLPEVPELLFMIVGGGVVPESPEAPHAARPQRYGEERTGRQHLHLHRTRLRGCDG